MVKFENRSRIGIITQQKVIDDLLTVNPPIDIVANRLGLGFSVSSDDRTQLVLLEIKTTLTSAQINQIITLYPELQVAV